MSRLFWRIFLSFWVAMVLIVGAYGWIHQAINQYHGANPVPDHLQFMLRGSAEQAADFLRRTGRAGGRRALERWLSRKLRPRIAEIYVFDWKGFELLGRDLPDQLQHLSEPGDPPNRLSSPRYYALTILDDNRRPFRVVAVSRVPPRSVLSLGREGQWLRTAIAVVISALVCWFLARYLSRPVSRLRWAAREMAAGNLAARVGQQGQYGTDELGQMAAEFDRMASRLEQSMGLQRQLLIDVSHELRSPLSRLQIATELARQRAGDLAEPELDRIEREAEKLNELIGEILHLSRQAGDEHPLELDDLDLSDLINEVVEDARLEATDSGRDIFWQQPDDPAPICGHATLLGRAVENVLRNALRHTPEGTRVEVVLVAGDEDYRLTIRDQGPGVGEDQLDHIFRPFYRIGEARDRASGGFGLGLAIADNAVRRHGGNIAAHNAEGGGLCVTMILPR